MQSKQFRNYFQEPQSKENFDYKALYTSCFPMVRSMVLKNSGTIDDARDVFQEAIMVLYQNSSFDKFQLTAVTSTYLYSIARNKWLKELRHFGRNRGLNDHDDVAEENTLIEDDDRKQKQRLLMKHLGNIGDKCQNIIKLFFEGMPGEEIAKELEYSSYEYYRVAKNRCIENLKKLIQNDPLFKELK